MFPYALDPMRRPGALHASGRSARTGSLLAALAAVTVLTGCMTGERPSLGTAPTAAGTETGDANVDTVLALLDSVSTAVFTAQYNATVRFGGTVTPVRATQSAPDRRSVTVGDVRYITDASGSRTCTVSTSSCADGTNPQPISNTGVTTDLVFGDVAKRLRRFAGSRVGATTLTQSTIAGQAATCVDLPVGTGVSTYCALDNGVLARLVDGDVTVEMTSYVASADDTLFTP